ncbi:PREDICTED: ER membrane protein complex subunit 7-like [Branchiostoma belcheri]|uniref:Endoplasmic reticulum membrane protein complex subunit 7 n=1 Tax=Branchiostoma belcheri TaxID=7741 RepID=A0A6P5ABV1_BRABE|nr:PREDICTED: ER membrane protein complex subunit 7-like [Branchiostoma belcheri]
MTMEITKGGRGYLMLLVLMNLSVVVRVLSQEDVSAGGGVVSSSAGWEEENGTGAAPTTFKVEGKAMVPGLKPLEWIGDAKIIVDHGAYLGFFRMDGSFALYVPSGSFVVEVVSPTWSFEPARVDVTAKGKIRARRVNLLQIQKNDPLPYPLRFKSKGRINYFERREQWRITDFLFNHMVIMMVLPLVLLLILPKMINTNDPEMQREMQQSMNMLSPNKDLPDMSEFFTKMFGGGETKKTTTSRKVKRRQ